MTITGRINLLKLKNARRVQDGNIKGIFIPIYDNPAIYAEGKGAYLSIRIVEKPSEYNGVKYSHFIAASLDKDQREKLKEELSDEELRSVTPILGNARTWGGEEQTYERTTLTPVDGSELRSVTPILGNARTWGGEEQTYERTTLTPVDGSELRSATGFQEEPDDLPFVNPAR